jgi:hypothetical protein
MSCTRADVTIVTQGKSTFSIVIPANTPSSVQAAAQELQRDIGLSTHAKLPIVKDADHITGNFISLGSTQQAAAAQISVADIAAEGFKIVTKDQNIYIIGPDTPDGIFNKNGGTSNGTANGVYTFIEDYLDVRWLRPGDLWRDVPAKSTFTVEEIQRQEAPFFISRRLHYIQNDKPSVQEWEKKQKLGWSFRVESRHNWKKVIPPSYYKEHPEWFPMIGGKRVPPKGNYKLETTNPEVVQRFAEKAITALKADPALNMFSLSPSDSAGWSASPESKALQDRNPGNRFSVTPLMLKFYTKIANRVKEEYPQGKLGGLLYNSYLFPPSTGIPQLPDNFYPTLAVSTDYGYQLYRYNNQSQLDSLLNAWSAATPHLSYYGIDNWLEPLDGVNGIIMPTATEIHNYVFPRLAEHHIRGIYLFGTATWDQAAVTNYMMAKMMWNPRLDANTLRHEWLSRAYGSRAGAAMEELYQKLDSWFRDYYRQHEEINYHFTEGMMRDIYAKHYPEMESLYLRAKSLAATDIQRQRLQSMESTFILLQWRLRTLNALDATFRSPLKRSDSEVSKIVKSQEGDLDRFPGLPPQAGRKFPEVSSFAIKKVELKETLPAGKSTFPLPNQNTFLIYAARDGKIRIMPKSVVHAGWGVTYLLQCRQAGVISSGLLVENQPIEFDATAGQDYYLYLQYKYLQPHPDIKYEVQINGATSTEAAFHQGTLTLKNKNAPVYVYGNSGAMMVNPTGVIITTSTTQ